MSAAPARERFGDPSRTSRLYRIAELMVRYKPREVAVAGAWRVWDCEEHKALEATYTDERHASAGARLAAACDIDALYRQ